ncbi:hypothetical protein NL154_05680 [Rhizobium sp. YTUHZ044]|uniref:hypothetical protein n=1 Tax=Rhizobium sp. YTUHZ044 TaxID=2962678 RepID=UPI003DA998DE
MSVASFDDRNIVPYFYTITIPNEAESKKQGRPIFDEMEVVEIRFGGDMQNRPVFPAHDGQYLPDGQGGTQLVTYAERFPKQYQQFKERKSQTKEGTPLEEAPFLTAKERSELKGLQIYTVEQLASLDDRRLKSLGMFGRERMEAAKAYLDAALSTADVTRLASENAELRELIAKLQSEKTQQHAEDVADNAKILAEKVAADDDPDFEDWSVEDLKAYIENETGHRPKGNPSKDTLTKQALEAYRNIK